MRGLKENPDIHPGTSGVFVVHGSPVFLLKDSPAEQAGRSGVSLLVFVVV